MCFLWWCSPARSKTSPLWRPLYRYDAINDAAGALTRLLGTLGLPVQGGQPSPKAQSPVSTSLPGGARPLLKSLDDLGFATPTISGIEVVLPPLCDVPAGSFTMGSDKAHDPQARDNETPQCVIEVEPFQIARYPVTVAEYACAVQAKAVREPPQGTWQPITWADQLKRLDHPVVCVSWHDAVAYAAWLAAVTGQPWRLPTEVEWEKAARGTDGRIYPWGNEWDKNRVNTDDGGSKGTTPVGTYAEHGDASPYGVHDLAGNVWEWTSSFLEPYPYRQGDGRENQNSSGNRVLRGGSWKHDLQYARAAYRNGNHPKYEFIVFGFRLVRAAPSPN